MIEIRALTKRYGQTTAVADLSFDVRPGVVTGFLGPNGAGKSTTMRSVVSLDHAGRHLDTTLGAPGVARVVIGGALYLTGVGPGSSCSPVTHCSP